MSKQRPAQTACRRHEPRRRESGILLLQNYRRGRPIDPPLSEAQENSIRKKLKNRIASADCGERLWRRAYGNREVGLHFALESVEVSLQNLWLLGVQNPIEAEFPLTASLLQRDFSRRLGVSHPLCSSARRDQITLAVQLQQIDWSRIDLPTLSSANLQQVIVGEPQTKADEESEKTVEDFFDAAGLAEDRERGVHVFIVGALL